MKIINFTWRDYDAAVKTLALMISDTKISKEIKCIYGVPRGGMVLAVSLSHALDLQIVTPRYLDCIDKDILVVDEICDTGKTLKQLNPKYSATIHVTDWAIFRPTFSIAKKEKDTWIQYPWEIKLQ